VKSTFSTVAFVPARSGSERIKNKNIVNLGAHPLIAYSIRAAIESEIFDAVICVTDSPLYADIALHYGAEVPDLRPGNISTSKAPDIDWVKWIIGRLNLLNREYEIFSILRPTSPFRTAKTIKRAFSVFLNAPDVHSLRAVELCKQHPGKMWTLEKAGNIKPLMPHKIEDTPWHSSQYAALPEVYVQNASLEFSWIKNISLYNTISGHNIRPFFSEHHEGFDINNYEDLVLARHYINDPKCESQIIAIPTYSEKVGN